ncbi:MAG: DUF3311 domain-containing protein [Sulfolobales archaeon]|nr:DUF3311 domain-containing protein [Sulfolobales archaeon]MDW8082698.1 DUF3311 domain-containing protein [Sulfolobales archaeon]
MPLTAERIAVLLAAIPPIVLILSAPVVLYIVEPRVLGMPFNLFWHLMWMVAGPFILTVAYTIRVREMRMKREV